VKRLWRLASAIGGIALGTVSLELAHATVGEDLSYRGITVLAVVVLLPLLFIQRKLRPSPRENTAVFLAACGLLCLGLMAGAIGALATAAHWPLVRWMRSTVGAAGVFGYGASIYIAIRAWRYWPPAAARTRCNQS
jgi:hypothetical protein